MKCTSPFTAALALAALTALNGCSGNSTSSSSTDSSDAGVSPSIDSANARAPLPEGILSASELVAYAKYKLTYVAPDQFTKEPSDEALNGRKFHIEIKGVGDGIEAPLGSVPLSTTYDANSETLDVAVDASTMVTGPDADIANFLTLHEQDENMPPEMMSNAFGAKKEIIYVKQMKLGVGNFGDKIGVFKAIPHDNGFVYRLSKKIHLNIEQARKYKNKYILTLDGDIFSDSKGKQINCFYDKDKPSLDITFPRNETACIINARLNSISALDPERHVLANWSKQ